MADREVGEVSVSVGRILLHEDMEIDCNVTFSYRTETRTHNSISLSVFVEQKDYTIQELKRQAIEKAYSVLEHVLSRR